jgi:hypothetical protein
MTDNDQAQARQTAPWKEPKLIHSPEARFGVALSFLLGDSHEQE